VVRGGRRRSRAHHLLRLPLKRVHLSSAQTAGIDFRLRRRLDPPAKEGDEGAPKEIRGSAHFPEIPGFTNPPDPKPEDLYPRKTKFKKPWTIHLGGVDVDGPIRVEVGRMRLEGEGVASGAMTYRTRDFVEVRRGNLRLTGGRLIIDSEVASDDLTLDVSSRWRAFPAKGAKLPQILEGVSGSFAIAGNIHSKASVPIELVPGLPISATGRLDTTLRLEDGTLQPDSSYAFTADDLRLGLLGLTAVGSARSPARPRWERPTNRGDDRPGSFSSSTGRCLGGIMAPASPCAQPGTGNRWHTGNLQPRSRWSCLRPRSAISASSAGCCP
jgi:hypothetical protein